MSVKEKVQKQHSEFAKEVQGLSPDALKQRIVGLQQGLQESEEHMEANEALTAAQDELRLLKGPYSDVRKAVKLKTQYILELLKESAE